MTIGGSNSSLSIDWRSFFGGDDTFSGVGFPNGSTIDGGPGQDTVKYESRSSADATIKKIGNSVQVTTFGMTDSLISVEKVQFADKTVDLGVGTPTVPTAPAPSPAPTTDLTVLDTSTGKPIVALSQLYTGPVAGLQHQYINITSDSLNLTAATDNWFLHSGPGIDAIAAHGGTNVLDGGTGSNFLVGGSGTDTFFVDARGASADIWSTMVNFHSGDSATVWGINAADFNLQWQDGQGAAGYTGLSLHAVNLGGPAVALTLAGFSPGDMASGRISARFGTDAASGSSFLYIHANS
jgi:Ca2+-binding RTX toxin-like protein